MSQVWVEGSYDVIILYTTYDILKKIRNGTIKILKKYKYKIRNGTSSQNLEKKIKKRLVSKT